MNDQPDLGQLVTDWLRADAAPRAPDRVLAVALDRVHGVGQERPFGGRRFDGWIRRSPRLGWAIVGAVLAAALLGAIAGVGAWLVQHEPRPNLNLVPPVVPSSNSNGWVAFAVQDGTRHGGSDIYMVKDGVKERLAIGTRGDSLRQVCPNFSPDGTKLAYSEAPATVSGASPSAPGAVVIVTLDAAGLPAGPAVRLPAPSPGDVCPKWAPDGQSVAFLTEGPQPGLWIGHFDGTETRVAGVEAIDGFGGQFDWSPAGTAFVAVGNASSSIWIVPLDGRPARLLGSAGSAHDFEYPRWSPDGTRIAVLSNTFEEQPDGSGNVLGSSIEVYRADGSGSPIELAGSATLSGSFGWSPDGRRLAYVRAVQQNGLEQNEIVTVAPEAHDVRVITNDQRTIRGLIWSPDRMRLLYVADAATVGSGGIVSVAAAGDAAPSRLTQQPLYLEFTSSDQVTWQPVLP